MKNAAIIVGGGIGTRFKGELPKQFLPLGESSIIVQTIETFQQSSSIDAIIVVVPVGWVQRCTNDLRPYKLHKVHGVIEGGATRQLSCWYALQRLKADSPEVIVVHDAVRPLVTETMVEVAVQEGHDGMTFGLRIVDTLASCAGGEINEILSREGIYQIQTPQAFPFSILWDAHVKAGEEGINDASDDAGLVLRAGYTVKVAEGDPRNIKITDQRDLELARNLIHTER